MPAGIGPTFTPVSGASVASAAPGAVAVAGLSIVRVLVAASNTTTRAPPGIPGPDTAAPALNVVSSESVLTFVIAALPCVVAPVNATRSVPFTKIAGRAHASAGSIGLSGPGKCPAGTAR